MPNPHFRVQVISRSGGRSAVAAAAYRSGDVLKARPSVVNLAAYRAGAYLGAASGETFDYTRKEGVVWTWLFLPAAAAPRLGDRQTVWNEVEAAERRKDGQLAREIEASLPRELTLGAWQTMCANMAAVFTRHGLIVDASVHNVRARDGGSQPHVHFLIPTRPVDGDGFQRHKTGVRCLNSRQALHEWRRAWEEITNRALEDAGSEARLSLRSYAARGLDREPTRPLGPRASALEKQGVHTVQGDKNRQIEAENALREARQKAEQAARASGHGLTEDADERRWVVASLESGRKAAGAQRQAVAGALYAIRPLRRPHCADSAPAMQWEWLGARELELMRHGR